MDEFAAYLGIDWADTKHDLCLVEAATGAKTTRVIRHTPEALAEYFSSLRAQYSGRQIAVALEQSRGPLLFALLQYDLFGFVRYILRMRMGSSGPKRSVT